MPRGSCDVNTEQFSLFQAQELRKYFKSLGAEISEEKSAKGIEDDLHKIVGVCDVCFKDGDPQEIDSILNSIVSIMVSVSIHRISTHIFLVYPTRNLFSLL